MRQTGPKRSLRHMAHTKLPERERQWFLKQPDKSSPSWSDNVSQDRLHNYDEVVHYLLRTFAKDENISQAIADLNRFSQGTLTEMDYSNYFKTVQWPAAMITGATICSACTSMAYTGPLKGPTANSTLTTSQLPSTNFSVMLETRLISSDARSPASWNHVSRAQTPRCSHRPRLYIQ